MKFSFLTRGETWNACRKNYWSFRSWLENTPAELTKGVLNFPPVRPVQALIHYTAFLINYSFLCNIMASSKWCNPGLRIINIPKEILIGATKLLKLFFIVFLNTKKKIMNDNWRTHYSRDLIWRQVTQLRAMEYSLHKFHAFYGPKHENFIAQFTEMLELLFLRLRS